MSFNCSAYKKIPHRLIGLNIHYKNTAEDICCLKTSYKIIKHRLNERIKVTHVNKYKGGL